MDSIAEAAAILTRTFEALARAAGKTLSARSREDIRRACELLSAAGPELDALLEDAPTMPRMRAAQADATGLTDDQREQLARWQEASPRNNGILLR